MQEFTKEYKRIKDALDRCWGERASKKGRLLDLQEARKKIFADIAVGKVSPSKRKIINSEIRQLEEDIEGLDIAVEELQLKETLIKRQGGQIQEVKED
ncbi:hypothetical protein ES705_21691 [subsurface metagenome]